MPQTVVFLLFLKELEFHFNEALVDKQLNYLFLILYQLR